MVQNTYIKHIKKSNTYFKICIHFPIYKRFDVLLTFLMIQYIP